ncbi:general secretion pathway protein F/type IV pilus assembly protein PilC [Roseimicrobium gellanilyticum]|uniref:General secretion pathway protein F n=1 Tax=Roseimicrobium gellanilyticum TaxID=748857 RepID=A0A366H1E9_9BACT|nr:type II secretion system F family protein [Roseimicrobium gellanilyticum]RBP35338.1 general secretion pathway protein F/type IV pilus assembly protein PilC [Roseimicrobium gellanilyticum]
MPAFRYEAMSTSGQRSAGTLEAADRGEAVRKLARRGLQPFSLSAEGGKPVAASGAAKEKNSKGAGETSAKTKAAVSASKAPVSGKASAAKSVITGPLKLSRSQVIQFTEELCDLLTAGLQLEQALHAMENRSVPVLRQLATSVRERVRDGLPLSAALHQVSPSFDELYCNLVSAGEAGGALGSILNRQARHLNQLEQLRAKVTGALIYPAFIIISGIALSVTMVTFLLPKMAALVESTGKELPTMAQWLMAMSGFIKSWWWLLIAAVILVVISVHVLFQDKGRMAWWHRKMLDLPMYGPVLRTRFEVQFLETLGNLLKNGLPLHRALELVRKATVNLYLREQLEAVETAVHDGGSLSRALERAGVLRPLVIDMVRVGEQTGEMADALEKAAERFDRQLTKTIEHATALLQPVLMLVMAVLVGGMVWMMINIVFSTLQQIQSR